MEETAPISAAFHKDVQDALKSVAKPEAALGAAAGSAPVGPSFAETAHKTAASFAEALRRGEETAKAGLVGDADPQSVVTALSSAEVAVQTAMDYAPNRDALKSMLKGVQVKSASLVGRIKG